MKKQVTDDELVALNKEMSVPQIVYHLTRQGIDMTAAAIYIRFKKINHAPISHKTNIDEIVRLANEGFTRSQIAEMVGLSPKSKQSITSWLKKAGKSRRQIQKEITILRKAKLKEQHGIDDTGTVQEGKKEAV